MSCEIYIYVCSGILEHKYIKNNMFNGSYATLVIASNMKQIETFEIF